MPQPSCAPTASVIIPAHNEAGYVGSCLDAILASTCNPLQIIVVANACTDDTARIAREYVAKAAAQGHTLHIIDTAEPGKLNALNLGDAVATGATRIYLDADVTVSPPLIGALTVALDRDTPAYASGTPQVIPPANPLLRAYARFWAGLPFVTRDVPGFGIFAVNAAGRQRWQAFPDIIADDIFVRLQFAAHERIRVAQTYCWPMVDGLANLIRVRRRQNLGVAEIAQRFAHLANNRAADRHGANDLLRRGAQDPFGLAAYALVVLATRLPTLRPRTRWARGR